MFGIAMGTRYSHLSLEESCRLRGLMIEHCRPTTCHTHEPAGLSRPPNASMVLPTRCRIWDPEPRMLERHTDYRIEAGDRERRPEVTCRIVHRLCDGPTPQHASDRIDHAMVHHRSAPGSTSQPDGDPGDVSSHAACLPVATAIRWREDRVEQAHHRQVTISVTTSSGRPIPRQTD